MENSTPLCKYKKVKDIEKPAGIYFQYKTANIKLKKTNKFKTCVLEAN